MTVKWFQGIHGAGRCINGICGGLDRSLWRGQPARGRGGGAPGRLQGRSGALRAAFVREGSLGGADRRFEGARVEHLGCAGSNSNPAFSVLSDHVKIAQSAT